MRVLLLIAILFGTASAQVAFTDLEDSRYREAISFLHGRDLIGGFPDGSFRPTQAMTRAEFLTMVMRAAALPEPAVSGQCLAAMPAGAWYAPVMCQGVSLGLISGEPLELRPQDTVLFSEALKIVFTAFGFQVRELQNGEAWYAPFVAFAGENGILPTLSFRPGNFVTREIAASVLYRSLVLAGDRTMPQAIAPPAEPPVTAVPDEPVTVPACAAGSLGAPPAQLTVNGSRRGLLTHVPAGLQPGQPASLVIAFHGRTNSNEQVKRYMRLDDNDRDSIVVYPAALPATGGGFSWQDPGDTITTLRDFELFDAIVELFSREYCIDQDRIFVVGHSLGAYFANSVACMRADTVRAVASVAGGILPGSCPGEVAALLFHNPNDTLVAISEGESARDVFLQSNRLTGTAPRGLGDPFNCAVYGSDETDSSVTWCRHGIDYPYGNTYDPHSWPAAIGPYMMEFFSQFR